MLLDEPARRAAGAVIERLTAMDLLEACDGTALVDELAAILEQHAARWQALVSELLASGPTARHALSEHAAARQIPRGDEAERTLGERLCSALLESPHVDELYADDATLQRIVAAALMDFVRGVEEGAFEGLRAPDSAASGGPPAISLAEAGYAFPLFEGPRDDAVVDGAGPCRHCGSDAELRFEGVCYACFRAGHAARSVDTELGMVRPEDAKAGITHGVPAELVTDPRGAAPVAAESTMRFAVDAALLGELTRTPAYDCRQGEAWLFCCGAPMIFTGRLCAEPGDRCPALDALCQRLRLTREAVVAALLEIDEAADVLEQLMLNRIDLYAFRCPRCGRRRAYGDR